jgi:ABC-type transport system substrate-binding protein
MDSGATSTSPKVRAQQYAIVQRRMSQQTYWIPLYFRPNIATVAPKLKNVVNNPTQAQPTWNVSAWAKAS